MRSQRPLLRNDLIEGGGFPFTSTEIAIRPRNTNDPNGYYEALGLVPWASYKEIKNAYRNLAKKLHPEGSAPDAEEFDILLNVYAVLSDPSEREAYDSTEYGSRYIGPMELADLRAVLSPDKIAELIEERVDRKPFFSYYGTSKESDLAQSWYHYLVAAANALLLKVQIRVSIQPVATPQITPGLVVLPRHVAPNYFSAFAIIHRLASQTETATQAESGTEWQSKEASAQFRNQLPEQQRTMATSSPQD